MNKRLPGNPHGYDPANSGYGPRAVAEAIYQLSYEQRTANLLAAATATWPNGSAMFPQISDGMRAEILERLGVQS